MDLNLKSYLSPQYNEHSLEDQTGFLQLGPCYHTCRRQYAFILRYHIKRSRS